MHWVEVLHILHHCNLAEKSTRSFTLNLLNYSILISFIFRLIEDYEIQNGGPREQENNPANAE